MLHFHPIVLKRLLASLLLVKSLVRVLFQLEQNRQPLLRLHQDYPKIMHLYFLELQGLLVHQVLSQFYREPILFHQLLYRCLFYLLRTEAFLLYVQPHLIVFEQLLLPLELLSLRQVFQDLYVALLPLQQLLVQPFVELVCLLLQLRLNHRQ